MSERALVLRAKSIPYVDARSGRRHVLLVESQHVDVAQHELADYEDENENWPPPVPKLARAAPDAMVAPIAFVTTIAISYVVTAGAALGLDWHGRGVADAGRILGGEVWRTITALFLHSGPVHVFSNLIFGALFTFFAAFNLGGGATCFALVAAGALGNATNAWMQAPDHLSIGASTAVFAAVGLMGGSEWRRQRLLAQPRLRVAAPIVMAACILAFHGVPEVPGNVDVMAHIDGFLWGLVFGALLPTLFGARLESPATQRALGFLALAAVLGSWCLAMM